MHTGIHLDESESYYRAVVQIEKQSISYKSQSLRLQNGIKVTADIFYDKRPIWQWLFQSFLH